MSDTFVLDVDQASELKHAFKRNGFTNAQIKELTSGDFLSGVRDVIEGRAELVVKKHLINLDADPMIPDGWKVEEHQRGGQFEWDASKVALYLDPSQQGGSIEGNKLRKKLKGKNVFNAVLLDYLLANPHLIPEEWKKDENGNTRYIFFWGTVYRRSGGGLCVRCLSWFGGRWSWVCYWLDSGWLDRSPAVVSAS
ncbi:MAG: hypothetical protein A2571_02890 [Candidatus Vogelbacteria bacterium RIFOXYD1_FULL_44_32]|uniref:Uncharacterized protein n=1 Tax=Candidatus Vogelbacteria bacterium RIFOXYD1_FULL_44_32 TaxID=1802438 RepID=A0A1G2QFD9_9BACT|nr:MAG: hypothetical protein A2571_02890 [Candidatus Vogelbacteria bacterium RIFOXYD1_FULL_44_32]